MPNEPDFVEMIRAAILTSDAGIDRIAVRCRVCKRQAPLWRIAGHLVCSACCRVYLGYKVKQRKRTKLLTGE